MTTNVITTQAGVGSRVWVAYPKGDVRWFPTEALVLQVSTWQDNDKPLDVRYGLKIGTGSLPILMFEGDLFASKRQCQEAIDRKYWQTKRL